MGHSYGPKYSIIKTLLYISSNVQFLVSGLKFIVIADPRQAAVDALLKKLYEVYSDFALKNPFYSLDMPIRYGNTICFKNIHVFTYI